MKLINQVKKIPDKPGLYFFLNKKGEVLYIGRATSLKKRVANYFRELLDPRLKKMVDIASQIKYKKTDTVLESIFLEANLIKKYWPKYNIKERDNRSFVYIIIPKTDYPYPILARERELDRFLPQGKIFGPYQSMGLLQSALRIIRRIFPYSTCRPNSGKPCFNYQIGLCPGACISKITPKEYAKNINNIILLLSGKKRGLLKKLERENPEKIKNLEHVQDVALITREELGHLYSRKFNRIEGYDISHLTGKETFGSMAVFNNGEKDSSQYRLFKIKSAKPNDDLGALVEIFERRLKHREWPYPDLIIVDGGKPQVNTVFKTLKKKFVDIPLAGISKLAGDKLVFPKNTKKSIKELIASQKSVLLMLRNEAHRFALKSSRHHRKIKKQRVI